MTDEGTPSTPEEPTLDAAPDPTPDLPPPPGVDTSVHTGAPESTGAGKKKGRLGLLVISLIALLVVGGGAMAGVLYMLRGTSDVLVGKAPEDTLLYATIYLDPAASQKVNLLRLADKFPAFEKEGLGKEFGNIMDEALRNMDMTYADDIEPWMGSQVGMVVVMDGEEPGAALMVDSENDGAAQAALDKLAADAGDLENSEYEGTTIRSNASSAAAVVDGTLVFSDSEDVVKQIIDTSGGDDSLSDTTAYSETMTGLPEERVAATYINGTEIVAAIKDEAGMALSAPGSGEIFDSLEAFEGLGMVVAIETDGVAMEFASSIDTSKLPENAQEADPHQNAVLAWSPEDSYALVTGTGLGGALQGLLDQADQISPGSSTALDTFGVGAAVEALEGDYGLVVNPGTSVVPGGALMMASKDDAAMQDFLDSISVFISQAAASGMGQSTASQAVLEPTQEIGDGMLPIKMTTPMWQTEEYEGVTISYLPLPDLATQQMGVAPSYAIADGMAIIASSPEEIKQLIDTKGGANITGNANYKSAIAHADADNTSLMFMNFEQILDTVEQIAPMDGEDAEVLANMRPLRAFVTTSGGTSERPTATVFILIQ